MNFVWNIQGKICRFFLRIFLLLIFLQDAQVAFPQPPPGYYDPAAGLTGEALQQALHGIIDDHTVLDYGALYVHFQSTDAKPGNVVWDMYSDIPGGTPPYIYHYSSGDECGNYDSEGDCYNREHSWPNSWFGGTVYPMYSDLFHLYPTDGYVNNKRGNYPFGTVAVAQWTSMNGSKLGICNWPGYNGTVFEPVDEYKGDFARSYFYIAVRYYGEDQGWPGSPMTNGSQLLPWALSMLKQWHAGDPVSQKETDRNNAVYILQANRNPFIDYPDFVFDLWGYPSGMESRDAVKALTVYPNPVADICRIFTPSGYEPGNASIRLFDLKGKEVIPVISHGANKIMVDLSGFKSGIYLLVMTTEQGQVFVARIMKKAAK